MNATTKPNLNWRFLAVGLILPVIMAVACLAALLLGAAWRLAAAPVAPPRAELVRVCVSMRLTGSPQLATWWAPVLSGRAGLMRRAFLQSSTTCGLARWQAWLPTSGTLQTPN